LIADTLNFDMIKATVGMEDFKNEDAFPSGEAFSVKISVDDKDLKKLSRQHNLAEIFVSWTGKSNECMLEMGRTTFNKLGESIYNKISRKHCVIFATREKRLIESVPLKTATESKEMIAETLCMNDLFLALPKGGNTAGKSKKNPSIHVNGEKVFDSDIEEKKEKQQFLSVHSSSKNPFLSAKSSKLKVSPSVIREEEKENYSSQSDEIFYTCPQIDESSRKVGVAYSYHVIYEIEDFSTNGTFLNGERLEKNKRILLKDGD